MKQEPFSVANAMQTDGIPIKSSTCGSLPPCRRAVPVGGAATERGSGNPSRLLPWGGLQPVRVGVHQRGEVAVEIPLIRQFAAGPTGSGADRKEQIDHGNGHRPATDSGASPQRLIHARHEEQQAPRGCSTTFCSESICRARRRC